MTQPFGFVGFEDHRCEDLKGVNFSIGGNDLSNSNLGSVNITGNNMFGVVLRHSDLTGAHLMGTNMQSVDMCDTNLSGADLTGALLPWTPSACSVFVPWPQPRYDCDTVLDGTIYDAASGGVDPQSIGWTLLNPPCATVASYGTVGPSGSFAPVSDRPKLGEPFTVALDDPFGGSSPGSFVAVLASAQPDPNFFDPLTPDGTLLPNLGMGGGAGELLVSLSPGKFLTLIAADNLWSGSGSPVQIDIQVPGNPALLGATAYCQGVFAAPGNVKLTEGLVLGIGN